MCHYAISETLFTVRLVIITQLYRTKKFRKILSRAVLRPSCSKVKLNFPLASKTEPTNFPNLTSRVPSSQAALPVQIKKKEERLYVTHNLPGSSRVRFLVSFPRTRGEREATSNKLYSFCLSRGNIPETFIKYFIKGILCCAEQSIATSKIPRNNLQHRIKFFSIH